MSSKIFKPSMILLSFFINSIIGSEKLNQLSALANQFYLTSDDTQSILQKLDSITDDQLTELIGACHNLAAKNVVPTQLNILDAVNVDPHHHQVIAENEYVRVLFVSQRAGEKVGMHTHQWPNVMLIITGSYFLTHNPDGSTESEEWIPGVYEFEGEDEPYAFTNYGESDLKAFCIELKKTLST